MTIVVPMLMSSINLAINDPYLILKFMGKTARKINKIVMIVILMFLSSWNQIFLHFVYKQSREIAVSKAKEMNEGDNEEVLELFEECKSIKKELVEFLRNDLGNLNLQF